MGFIFRFQRSPFQLTPCIQLYSSLEHLKINSFFKEEIVRVILSLGISILIQKITLFVVFQNLCY